MDYHKPYHVCTFRIIALMLIVVPSLLVSCSVHANEIPLGEVREFENGKAYKTGDNAYWVLTLNGTWQEMGRQYGGLVGGELCRFYMDISRDIADRGMGYDEQLESAKALASNLSSNLNDLLKGIAETSGLNKDEVLILNASMSSLAGLALGLETPSACSGLAVWDKYTTDGTLVFGRNWDIDRKSMQEYMKYLSVVVFNPDSGNAFANVHPLGSVYLETGMNDKGLFLELNNGMSSDPQYIEDREDTISVLVAALNECSTISEASKYLSDIPADLSHIIQIADGSECVSVERATFGARVRTTEQKGVLAAYNSFVPPYPEEWKGRVTDPPAKEDDPRYDNLINLANSREFFGKLDVSGMKRLMDVEVRHGGAVHKGTVYQVIAVPERLTLWIRALDYSDWQQVDLKDLFGIRQFP